MKRTLFAAVDTISAILGYASQAMVLILIGSMLYEVVARYAFGAPTLWAFDIAYMSTGALFILGAAQALREDAHVRIDFLSSKLPARIRGAIDGIVFLLVLTPIFGLLTYVASYRTWRAWMTGEVEHVSPWAPLMWPFYSALAIGLAALTLQLAIEGMRAFSATKTQNSYKIET
ncbi:TRAP transporter small permease subunit [Ahrensia kielensis]|uniref:TRAP transporter small permease subunit n=1 Tax=Ahrensia kielensis TaxID=76980 RepID=UPI00035E283A|nr:TRAP transporter small permease subunit [Ahrensia kielensis]